MKSALELLKRVVFTEHRPILPLGGAICAMVTPFRQGVVDEDAFRRHADWLIAEGVGSLVPCGTTGESPTLNEAERFRLIRVCVEVAAGRVPVVAGVGTNATNATIKQVRAAQEAGADAALVVTPYYNRPSQEGLCQHYEAIVQLVDFPVILYNVPQRCGVDLETPSLIRLADKANIIGLKDATGDLSRPLNLSRSLPKDFMLLSGDDTTSLDFNAAGGRGCISVVANVMPRLYAAMQYASLNGDMAKARELLAQLGPLISALAMETSPGPVKYALSLVRRGISPELRLPLVPVHYETAVAIRRALDGLRRKNPAEYWQGHGPQEPGSERHGSERISVA